MCVDPQPRFSAGPGRSARDASRPIHTSNTKHTPHNPTYYLHRLGLVGPLLAVRLQTALHPDAERAAAHFAASEAANDGRCWVGTGPLEGGGGGAAAAAAAVGKGGFTGGGGIRVGGEGGYYYAGQPPPVQDNPMLDILQVKLVGLFWGMRVMFGWAFAPSPAARSSSGTDILHQHINTITTGGARAALLPALHQLNHGVAIAWI